MSNVRQLRPRSGQNEAENDVLEGELRRQAVIVAAQLPNDLDDAIKVLDLAKRIVVEFLKC